METNQMREEFETQFVEEYVRVLGEGARELAAHALAANSPVVSMSWWAWQASRESWRITNPFPVADGDPEVLWAHAKAQKSLEAQGLKVTP